MAYRATTKKAAKRFASQTSASEMPETICSEHVQNLWFSALGQLAPLLLPHRGCQWKKHFGSRNCSPVNRYSGEFAGN